MTTNTPAELIPPEETPPDVLVAMKALTTAIEEDVPKLPESLFVQHLLPLLKSTTGDVDWSVWLDIAGQANRPIDVVDNATGDKLFRIPPLLRSVPTRGPGRVSFSRILEQAKMRADMHPKVGQTYLVGELSKVDVTVEQSQEARHQLAAILARYGVGTATAMTADSSLPASAATTPALSAEEDEL